MWKLISKIEGRPASKGVGEQGTGKNIWASKRILRNFKISLMNYNPQKFY
jgi:hypothetical protein